MTGTHFLLAARARQYSLVDIARMSEDEARAEFTKMRFLATGGEPHCLKCGTADPWWLATRRVWKCRGCGSQFSCTSGTIFSQRKLPLRDILFALAVFANSVEGMSSLQMSRHLNVQYKTAFVLVHKIRAAIEQEQRKLRLSGEVEVDGAFFGGYYRAQNHTKKGRVKRVRIPRIDKRRVVVVMREREGRTIAAVSRSEHQAVGTVCERVEQGALIFADKARSWDRLNDAFATKRIAHQDSYSTPDACTNMAESYFARLRRAQYQHHRMSGDNLLLYAAEIAWREDARRLANGEQLKLLGLTCLSAAKNPFKGYWQRRRSVFTDETIELPRRRIIDVGGPKIFHLDDQIGFDRTGTALSPSRSIELGVQPEGEGAVFRRQVLAFASRLRRDNPEWSDEQVMARLRAFVSEQMAA